MPLPPSQNHPAVPRQLIIYVQQRSKNGSQGQVDLFLGKKSVILVLLLLLGLDIRWETDFTWCFLTIPGWSWRPLPFFLLKYWVTWLMAEVSWRFNADTRSITDAIDSSLWLCSLFGFSGEDDASTPNSPLAHHLTVTDPVWVAISWPRSIISNTTGSKLPRRRSVGRSPAAAPCWCAVCWVELGDGLVSWE